MTTDQDTTTDHGSAVDDHQTTDLSAANYGTTADHRTATDHGTVYYGTTADHRAGDGNDTTAEEGIAMRSFSESLPMALLKARESAMRVFRPLLAEHGLTEQQWRVLRALAAAEGHLEVGALAERTFLLSPSLSRILVTLQARDLIARATPAHDRRRSLIALTPAGRWLMARFAPRGEAAYAEIEQQFGPVRLQRLLDELHELAALDFVDLSEEAG